MLLLLAACSSLECGPGTVEADGVCVPAKADDTGGSTDSADSGDSGDTVETGETGDTVETGDTADTADTAEAPLQVYLLAGQSNMDGYAYFTGLSPSQRVADPRVPLYWSGWGEFRSLAASSYGGSVFVGPEVTLGRTLADAGVPVALVKHAVGGTDLAAYWYPGTTPDAPNAGPGFSVLADSVDAATRSLDAAGRPWRWAGFAWMQGESDALNADYAAAYEANLTAFIEAVRTITGEPALPAAIGLISTESIWTYADEVRAAQQAVAAADPQVYVVETDDLPRNSLDTAHYDGPSNRVLGERFARALLTASDIPAGDDAPVAAFTISEGANNYDFTGTCGWEFELAAPVVVTDLGAYGASYLTVSADVGIWDAGANLVAVANVPCWYDAPANWRGSVWYTAIDPIRLEAGTYRIGMVSWDGDADRYLNSVTGTFADGVTFTKAAYAEGYWLTYPSVAAATPLVSYVGPDFLFVPG